MIEGGDLVGIAVGFGCGLLIGVEREHRKSTSTARRFAGVRTFALTGLIGGVAQVVGHGLVVVSALLVLALTLTLHWRERDHGGITTELALYLSFLLGVVAIGNPEVAAGAAVVVAATLNLRSWLHHFARVSLTPGELRDALILAGAALVVRPLLPDAGSPWLLGINPKTLWTLAVVIMCIQAGAHVALRLAGPRLGLALAGFASGLISSIATTAAMGSRCRADATLRGACIAGALLSNVSTFVLLWVVALAIAPEHLARTAPILVCGTAAALGVAAASLWGQRHSRVDPPTASQALSAKQALLFAAGLSGATLAVAYANARFGTQAGVAGAAIAGFFDLHAAAGSALALLAGGTASAESAVLAVLLAMTANMSSKIAAAAASGGIAFALPVGRSLLLVLLASWLPYWF